MVTYKASEIFTEEEAVQVKKILKMFNGKIVRVYDRDTEEVERDKAGSEPRGGL